MTDENGRICNVKGSLTLKPRKKDVGRRDEKAQKSIVEEHRTKDATGKSIDDGGHLMGNQFWVRYL